MEALDTGPRVHIPESCPSNDRKTNSHAYATAQPHLSATDHIGQSRSNHDRNPTSDCVYDIQEELRVGVGDTDICNKILGSNTNVRALLIGNSVAPTYSQRTSQINLMQRSA